MAKKLVCYKGDTLAYPTCAASRVLVKGNSVYEILIQNSKYIVTIN